MENQSFLEKIVANSNLQTVNEAQVAAKVVYRILRDMMPQEQVDKVASELETEAPKADMEIKDLWKDTNPMVSFFSQLSPVQNISQSPGVFKLRLSQEGALPTDTDPENVTKAIFKATKDELSGEQISNVSQSLPDDIRSWWDQA
ncbi:MAG: DUF2267 domain-containing protein [Cyanophyceae cyanobacterium]